MSGCFRYSCLLLIFLSSAFALAQTFPIIGSASLVDAYETKTNARGTDLYYQSYVGDAADGFGFCYSGQVCNGTVLTGANQIVVYTDQMPIAYSSGCLGDVCTPGGYLHGMSGILNVTYTFSFITPSTDQDISLAVPISVSTTLNAIGVNNQTLWTVNISGKGTAKLSGCLTGGLLKFDAITFKYAGTGSVAAAP